MRALLAKKVENNRSEIKTKLTALGAPNVTALAKDKYPEFVDFLNGFESNGGRKPLSQEARIAFCLRSFDGWPVHQVQDWKRSSKSPLLHILSICGGGDTRTNSETLTSGTLWVNSLKRCMTEIKKLRSNPSILKIWRTKSTSM